MGASQSQPYDDLPSFLEHIRCRVLSKSERSDPETMLATYGDHKTANVKDTVKRLRTSAPEDRRVYMLKATQFLFAVSSSSVAHETNRCYTLFRFRDLSDFEKSFLKRCPHAWYQYIDDYDFYVYARENMDAMCKINATEAANIEGAMDLYDKCKESIAQGVSVHIALATARIVAEYVDPETLYPRYSSVPLQAIPIEKF